MTNRMDLEGDRKLEVNHLEEFSAWGETLRQ